MYHNSKRRTKLKPKALVGLYIIPAIQRSIKETNKGQREDMDNTARR